MKSLLPIVAVLVVLVGVLPLVLKQIAHRKGTSGGKLPYRKKDYLLTVTERSFYEVLRSIAGDELEVFAKVRLLDLVYLPKGTDTRQSHTNRVMSKHVDFLLCERQNVSPLLVIELDDSSHERDDRAERDAFVDEALGAAGLPILHITAKHSYIPKELAVAIPAETERFVNRQHLFRFYSRQSFIPFTTCLSNFRSLCDTICSDRRRTGITFV